MSKTILIISSSPRRGGNSNNLCDQFANGAEESENRVEKIYLRDKKINYCLGCLACQHNGGNCVQKDDMSGIIDKMIKADVIVLATPVYFYSMSAQMKTMIDRCCPKYTSMKGKKFYYIATSGDSGKNALDGTITGFRGFLSCLDAPEEAGIIYGTGVESAGDIKGHPAMEQAYEMGKNA